MKIKTSDTVEIAKNVVSKNVEQDIVVLNLEDGTYFKLNETGAFTWQMLAKGAPIDKVIEEIIKVYKVSHETAENDIVTLINELQKEGLLKVVSNPERR